MSDVLNSTNTIVIERLCEQFVYCDDKRRVNHDHDSINFGSIVRAAHVWAMIRFPLIIKLCYTNLSSCACLSYARLFVWTFSVCVSQSLQIRKYCTAAFYRASTQLLCECNAKCIVAYFVTSRHSAIIACVHASADRQTGYLRCPHSAFTPFLSLCNSEFLRARTFIFVVYDSSKPKHHYGSIKSQVDWFV